MALAEKDILENRELREKLIKRLDVLDKVKAVVGMPSTELLTTKQVADYYEVDTHAIIITVTRNRGELEQDGVRRYSRDEIINILKEASESHKMRFSVKTLLTKAIVQIDNQEIAINNTGLLLFTRRALLRVGMLLRDSEVAKRVRTYLLDVEEHAPVEVKTKELDEETRLLVNVIQAQNREEFATAMYEYRQYMLRYKQQAEQLVKENDALAKGVLTVDARPAINKMVRRFATRVCNGNFAVAWGKLYDEMLYKHHICVRSRLNNAPPRATIFEVLNADELKLAVKSVVALCRQNNVDISDILFQV